MKVLATVLLGPGSESVVGEAIASVANHVDGYIFIGSGGGEVAYQAAFAAARKPYTAMPYAWESNYGAARQFALDQAKAEGADYALTLDPDERIELHDSFRSHLEAYPDVEVWIVADADTGYFKERVIRASANVHWHGRVCEFLAGREVAGSKLPGVFRELPKSQEAEHRRFARGVVECQRMIDEGDDCYRWRRHGGTCLMGLGRQAEALEWYEKALPLAAHADETAWMRYLICEQYVIVDRMQDARDLAAKGIADHAGFLPEFGWILGFTDMKLGNNQNASRWAQLVTNTPPDRTRIGFRGQNCKKGARQILTVLHNMPAVVGDVVECHGIKVPTAGLSENMKRVLADGKMESAELGLLSGLLTKDDSVLSSAAGAASLPPTAPCTPVRLLPSRLTLRWPP
jgi:tetratricopeptide (TPR) repeat protein